MISLFTLKTGPNPPSPSFREGWKFLVAATRALKGKSFCSWAAIVSKSSSFWSMKNRHKLPQSIRKILENIETTNAGEDSQDWPLVELRLKGLIRFWKKLLGLLISSYHFVKKMMGVFFQFNLNSLWICVWILVWTNSVRTKSNKWLERRVETWPAEKL